MTMIDRWPFGTAVRMPSAQCKYWGDIPRSLRKLRPIITELVSDGHPPDAWRNCLLPPEADQSVCGSIQERNLLAQSLVLRYAVIQRNRPSASDGWLLHGYVRKTDDVSGGCLLPDLTPASRSDLREPWMPPTDSLAQSIAPQHPVLKTCMEIGHAFAQAGSEEIQRQIQNENPEAKPLDRVIGLIVALVAGYRLRVDLYRAWGGAMNAALPVLRELKHVTPLLPVLDASVLLAQPAGEAEEVVADLKNWLRRLHFQGEQAWSV